MDPSFNGISLGPCCYVIPTPNPNDYQINSYPGVNGLEILGCGSRGGITTVHGAAIGDTLADLAAVEQTFRAMMVADVIGVLVDSLGLSWPGVRILAFAPQGPIYGTDGNGVIRNFEIQFLHAS